MSRLVRDRLERLPDEATEVLRWGAVLGRTFSVRRLEPLLGIDVGELSSALLLLERHDLLRASPGEGDGGGAYAFAHDLVRRAVHAELSEPRRRLMHLRIARALAEEGGAGDALAADIALHAALAGEHRMAARACAAAGRRCLRLFAYADADALARRGMRHADALPEPERVPLLLELFEVALSARRPDAADEVAEALLGLSERALALGCRAHARLGFHLLAYLRWEGGAGADARRYVLRAEEVSRATSDPERVLAMAEAGRCLAMLGQGFGEAEALLLEARALGRQLSMEPFAICDALGLLRMHEGRLDEAAELFARARAVAGREADRLREFQAVEHLVMLEQERGRWDAALALAEALVELGGKLREGSEAPAALRTLCDHAEGRPDAASRLDEATGRLRVADAKHRLGYVLSRAAEIDLTRGDAALARARAEEALRIAALLERPSELAWARALLARACDGADAEHHRSRLREEASREVSAYVRGLAQGVLPAAGDARRSKESHGSRRRRTLFR